MDQFVHEFPQAKPRLELMIKAFRQAGRQDAAADRDRKAAEQYRASVLYYLELRDSWCSARIALETIKNLSSAMEKLDALGFSTEALETVRAKGDALEQELARTREANQAQEAQAAKLVESARLELHTAKKKFEKRKGILSSLRDEEKCLANKTAALKADLKKRRAEIEVLQANPVLLELQNATRRVESLDQQLAVLEEPKPADETSPSMTPSQTDPMCQVVQKLREKNRRLRHQLMSLRKNIRVFCRIRKPMPAETGIAAIAVPGTENVIQVVKQTVSFKGKASRIETFALDKVFGPDSTNFDVFFEVELLIQNALEGNDVCIFAYGQTGAGKTHTMLSESGIVRQSVDFIFKELKSLESTECSVTAECVELYLDQVFDLFSADKDTIKRADPSSPQFGSPEEVHDAVAAAIKRRTTKATAMNHSSSRSHFILSLRVRIASAGAIQNCVVRFVDLAGSERVDSQDPDRLQETKAINSSLSVLGTVVKALGQRNTYVPYRASKLTELLAPSLTPAGKVLLLVNVAPGTDHVAETLSTLRFAVGAHSARLDRS